MKKRFLLPALLAVLALLCSACGNASSSPSAANSGVPATKEVPVILNQAEYLLYQNIFYNNYMANYNGTETEKQGVFAVLQDAFNGMTRYYVWGYLDNTRCCDWQWEFVPKDTAALPTPGSVITVKGTYETADEALDDLWIVNAEVTVHSRYDGDIRELNMRTMSDTLERVQIMNIIYKADYFEGKAFNAYGRIASMELLQDPYYDGSWQVNFSAKSGQTIPAIGTTVLLQGKVQSGALSDCSVTTLDE
ncbi:MAG: hypothetical protein IKQ41_12275 [Clostridia bacterium]|nr:hypothetical protein [Clostridia bacterium]